VTVVSDLQGHPGHRFICHLKANMRLSISDQSQPRLYLAPFSHNTSVTDDGQKNGRTDYNHDNSSTVI